MSVPYDETVLTANVRPPAPGSGPAGSAGAESAGSAAAIQAPPSRELISPSRLTGRPVVRAALGAACISSSAIMVTLANVGPATTAFYRCLLALPVLVLLAVLEQRKEGPRPMRRRVSAWMAGLLLAVDLILWNHSIADVGAGVATVLGNLQVLFVAVLAWMLAGIGYGLGTSVAYAGFLLILRQTAGPAKHIAGQLADATAGAVVGSLLLGLAFGGLQFDVPWHSLRWLLILALMSQTLGWLLITSSLPRLPAAVSSLLLLLQPAAALVLADIVLGERPTLIQVLGAGLVCAGVLAATWAASARQHAGHGVALDRAQAVTAKST
jgi:drug/metabolite transporter (DMT)-like permease